MTSTEPRSLATVNLQNIPDGPGLLESRGAGSLFIYLAAMSVSVRPWSDSRAGKAFDLVEERILDPPAWMTFRFKISQALRSPGTERVCESGGSFTIESQSLTGPWRLDLDAAEETAWHTNVTLRCADAGPKA